MVSSCGFAAVFNDPSYFRVAGAGFTPPTPGAGLAWDTSQLVTSGTLIVSSGGGGSIKINSSSASGGQFSFSGSAGAGNANVNFSVVTNANFAPLHTSWNVQGTGTCDGSGNFNYSVPLGGAGLFYDIRIP